jgi:hypothetical protein
MNKTGVSASTIMFTYWTGSNWSLIENVSTYWRVATNLDFIIHNSNNITAFLGAESRDLARFHWDGNLWRKEETIIDWVTGYATCWGIIPINHHEEFQFYFGEWDAAGKYFNFVKQYAWGSNGFLKGSIGTHARFWVEFNGDSSSLNRLIYIYYGNPAVNSQSQVLKKGEPVKIDWGIEETVKVNYQIEWEQKCQNLPRGLESYILTIYANSDTETFSIHLWSPESKSWVDSNVDIGYTLKWYNITVNQFFVLDEDTITWRYVDNSRNPDSDPAGQLSIDFVSVKYGGVISSTESTLIEELTSRIITSDFIWISTIFLNNLVFFLGIKYKLKNRENTSSLIKGQKTQNLSEFFQK